MGLLKKINKPSLQSVYRRKKAAEAKLKGDDDQVEQLSSAQFIVTSYPKEYSDTSSCPGCTSSTTSTDANTDPISPNNKQIDASSPPDCNENSGGWSWLISCWGSSFLLGSKAPTDDRTYDSTSSSSNEDDGDGGSGDSSHSMSRIDTVLNLGKPDDVSDITSAASVDDSLSDSEDGDDDDDEGDMSGSRSR